MHLRDNFYRQNLLPNTKKELSKHKTGKLSKENIVNTEKNSRCF